MNRKTKNSRGMTLPLVALVAFGLAVMVLFIANNLKANSHELVYLGNMNRAYRLAESGLSAVLGRLSVDPDLNAINGVSVEVPGEGFYENFVKPVPSYPVVGGYFILTSATRTAAGKMYATRLHTYAVVANIGDYFAALSDSFVLSPGMNGAGGKIYAPNVAFLISSNTVTRLEDAEYVHSCSAEDINSGFIYNSASGFPPGAWSTTVPPGWPGGRFILSSVPNSSSIESPSVPTPLPGPRKFPEISGADLTRYQQIATNAHSQISDFSGYDHIYPPGYEGPADAGAPDPYPYHDGSAGSNGLHVYYSTVTIRIGKPTAAGTVVHGQILFVSAANIEITGNLRSSANNSYMPGAGSASSSTAHQAVLIAHNDIGIRTHWQPDGSTTTLQGMLFCPNGSLVVEASTNPTYTRHYNFTGSKILGRTMPMPNNLPSQFIGTREYTYMTSLKDHPPPYLPALAEIYYSLEEITASPNLY